MENYDAAVAAVSAGAFSVSMLFSLAVTVLVLVAQCKLFVKAGKPGWACLIPFYNMYCLYDIAMGSGWLFLLQFVPCVNFVMMIMLYIKLAKAYGKGTGFGIGLIFLSPIFLMILAFSNAEYIGPQ